MSTDLVCAIEVADQEEISCSSSELRLRYKMDLVCATVVGISFGKRELMDSTNVGVGLCFFVAFLVLIIFLSELRGKRELTAAFLGGEKELTTAFLESEGELIAAFLGGKRELTAAFLGGKKELTAAFLGDEKKLTAGFLVLAIFL
ncbi:14953_t:CDS:1 [Dentiscutata heterogama]|uniref:14953_t:CDS:1 n=1 Tax=Dentiscutata heterogama TaxID=1316150 RepID=A0ACA9P713_9GLOM|nr:14953_t:CDS:1 [Dentiscutata heterogama]